MFSYEAKHASELTVERGHTVTVLGSVDVNWAVVRRDDGVTGNVPKNRLEVVDKPRVSSPAMTPRDDLVLD